MLPPPLVAAGGNKSVKVRVSFHPVDPPGTLREPPPYPLPLAEVEAKAHACMWEHLWSTRA